MKSLRSLFSRSPKYEFVGQVTDAPVEQSSPMVDIDGRCRESVGIETLGGRFTRLIQRGSYVPCKVVETFSTAQDSQTSLRINVFRGEGDQVKEVYPLREYEITNIPKMLAGSRKFK